MPLHLCLTDWKGQSGDILMRLPKQDTVRIVPIAVALMEKKRFHYYSVSASIIRVSIVAL